MASSRDLTKGSIYRDIASLTLPMVIGIVAVFSVSLVDTYYVGKLGTDELAALAFTFPITMAVASLSSGLGAGAASVVSRAIGSKSNTSATRLASDSLLLAMVIVVLISVLGLLTIEPLFSLLGAKGEILNMVNRYMCIWYYSMPFLVIPMVANSIIRSVGDAFWPSVIMVGTAAVNIVVTPILIFGLGPVPAFDIEGAAYGTLFARAVSLVFALYVAIYRERIISLAKPAWEEFYQSCKNVLEIAIPAAAGSVVNPVGIAILTSILAAYSSSTVASFGVATRIESFACIPMLALSAAIGPIVGQSWGANKKARVLSALKKCYLLCFVWSVFLAIFFYFAAEPISAFLASSDEVSKEVTRYLSIVTLSLFGYGFIIVSSAAFNSLGRSVTGLAFYLIRTAVFYVPLSFAASIWFASEVVYYAIAIANVLAGLMISTYCLWWLAKAKQHDCVPTVFARDYIG